MEEVLAAAGVMVGSVEGAGASAAVELRGIGKMINAETFFTAEEEERIRQAVVAAEQRTAGEIVPMLVGASARYACPVSNFDQAHGETHRCGNQKEPEPDFQSALWQAMRKASAKWCDVARYWCDHDDADHRDKADREGRQQILMR